MSQENSGSNFSKGVLIGGAIGAVLALLFAPKSGRELRADIGRKSKELYDDSEEWIAKGRAKAGEVGRDISGKLHGMKTHLRGAFDQGTQDEAAR